MTYTVPNNISRYDDEIHIMSTTYILQTEDMLQNTLRVSTLHHNHSKLRGHMNQFQVMDTSKYATDNDKIYTISYTCQKTSTRGFTYIMQSKVIQLDMLVSRG